MKNKSQRLYCHIYQLVVLEGKGLQGDLHLRSKKLLILPAVDCGNKAVRFHPNLLGEVVPEMPPGLLPRAVGHNGQDGVHREGQVH